MIINPNLDLMDRPLVALTVAIMTNTVVDLSLAPDHRVRHCMLGAEDGRGTIVEIGIDNHLQWLYRVRG